MASWKATMAAALRRMVGTAMEPSPMLARAERKAIQIIGRMLRSREDVYSRM
jgi:hypothetical protein